MVVRFSVSCGKFEIAAYNGSKETWEANVTIAANNAPLDLAHIIWNGTVYVPAGSISVIINGVRLEFDQPPVIIDGRTMVPLRAIFEALGADVVWDDAAKMVTAKREKRVVMLEIGKRHITMDGVSKELDVPAQIVNNRTLVSIRAVSEAYDCEVGWDAGTRTVVITEKMKK